MAKMTGFVFQDAYLAKVASLSDQELGRLVRALAAYHATGEQQKLAGRESIAYDFIKSDIDEIDERYAIKCENNRRNRTQTIVNDRKPSSTNAPKIKEKEKDKDKDKRNNTPLPPKGFDDWWAVYPKKQDKQKAIKAFALLDPDDALLQRMIQATKAWAKSTQWTRDGGQYIPLPTTWLNGRRWEDEIPKVVDLGHRVSAQMYTQREYTDEEWAASERKMQEQLFNEARAAT